MELAVQVMFQSSPEKEGDPLVGAVLVDPEGNFLAEAHRGKSGSGHHGEFSLLEKVMGGEAPSGCTIYVTLEPCNERGVGKKACAYRVAEARPNRVVVGMIDPNPRINGRGVEILRQHGIPVDPFDEDLTEQIKIANKAFIDSMEGSMGDRLRVGSASPAEKQPRSAADLNDLSEEAIGEYAQKSGVTYSLPSEALWASLHKKGFLQRRIGETGYVPTLLGVLVFGKDPTIFYKEAFVRATRFEGTLADGRSEEREAGEGHELIKGPLHEVVDRAEDFYKEHAAKVRRVVGFNRLEGEHEYPDEAVREAIVNALIHRTYEDAFEGCHVSFEMYRDRIVVSSPGDPVAPNSIEDMNGFKAKSQRRNPGLGDAAYKLRLMERKGEGLNKMRDRLREYGLRPPHFDFDGTYTKVTLYGRAHSAPSELIPSSLRNDLRPRHLYLLDLIREEGRITSEKYRKAFGELGEEALGKLGERDNTITRETVNQDFRRLKEFGLIDRRGVGKATYYVLAEFFMPPRSL
jgi:predicted HTH transcriptional regulator/pyrimidine deaminase RibD-like protein